VLLKGHFLIKERNFYLRPFLPYKNWEFLRLFVKSLADDVKKRVHLHLLSTWLLFNYWDHRDREEIYSISVIGTMLEKVGIYLDSIY
jgi:hypothetical protein